MKRGVGRWAMWAPLCVFVLLLAIVATGLHRPADQTVRSALVGQQIPAIDLPPAVPGKPGLTGGGRSYGAPRLVNIFASWCVPCIAEAPQLMRLKAAGVPIDAVAVRDRAPAIAAFLRRHGDPYRRIGDDKVSAVQLALGSSGVPETFVVDGRGTIVAQHIGEVRPEDEPGLLAAIEQAR